MYLFNPDNDLALANFSANYTPPASAVKLAWDLALLPVWYAPDGTKIVADGAENEAFLSDLKMVFAVESTLIPFSDVSCFPTEKMVPWGWNPALRKKLSDVGVAEENLPTMAELKRLREYSGRQYAVQMLGELKKWRNDFCGESHYFATTQSVLAFLAAQPGNSVLKMPNSGSGKGLVWVLGEITDKQTDWCRRVIRQQGGVVAEPVLDKKQDFAMEFFAENGAVRFSGYSLFQSAASGAYSGNYLLSDAKIENRLSEYVPAETLHSLKSFYPKKLAEYFPHYNGCIGVDMMVCKTPDGYRLQPCVEINVRMNMGMVARIFCDRFVAKESSGKFAVDYFKTTADALRFHQTMRCNFPLIVENGRIKSGYQPLTPVTEKTNYAAWVNISDV